MTEKKNLAPFVPIFGSSHHFMGHVSVNQGAKIQNYNQMFYFSLYKLCIFLCFKKIYKHHWFINTA